MWYILQNWQTIEEKSRTLGEMRWPDRSLLDIFCMGNRQIIIDLASLLLPSG